MKIHEINHIVTPPVQRSNLQKISNKETASDAVATTLDVNDSSNNDVSINGTDKTDANKELSDEENKLMAKSVDQANNSLKLYERRIELSVHPVTKTVMYTLRDTKTNDVIAEFPPKKIQDMIAKMWELAGLFVDKKA